MSGGALNYSYAIVQDTAEEVILRATTPLQRAFGEHLFLVAKALRDLEWILSGDTAAGDEITSIKAVVTEQALLKSRIRHTHKLLQEKQNDKDSI